MNTGNSSEKQNIFLKEKTIKDNRSAFNGSFSSELLAPAGSKESFYAAINAGADAVYMGGSMFGARAFAENPVEDELLSLIDYAHINNKKLFLTVNTLLKEDEIKRHLFNYLLPYYKNGLDGVIVQDFGVMQFINDYFPDLPIHASTQMTTTNIYMAKLLKKVKNLKRIVVARELSLNEIRQIYDETHLEIEAFVHGALCYSYSGQCMFSSIVGNRSGNRGRCAQPCRLPYTMEDGSSKYILSPRDLMTLPILPDILNAGVYSLKIEGRMKKPEYVASVVSVYRYYLDKLNTDGIQNYKVDEKDISMLMDIYNRGNFTTGYFYNHNGKNMMSLNRPNHAGVNVLKQSNGSVYHVTEAINAGDIIEIADESITVNQSFKSGSTVNIFNLIPKNKKIKNLPKYINRTRNNKLIDEITEKYLKSNKKCPADIIVNAFINQPLQATVVCGDNVVNVEGAVVTEALNKPVTADEIKKQFKKTGNTPFDANQTDIYLDNNIFINLKDCNELRRKAFAELEDLLLSKFRRDYTGNNDGECSFEKYNDEKSDKDTHERSLTVLVSTFEQLYTVLDNKNLKYIDKIYLDIDYMPLDMLEKAVDMCHDADKNAYIAMPYIFRKETSDIILNLKEIIENINIDGFLARNLETYVFLNEHGFAGKNNIPIVFDYTIYNYNSYSNSFLNNLNPEYKTAPFELDYHELKELSIKGNELQVYGYFPLMFSAQCINKSSDNCIKSSNIAGKQLAYSVITDRLGNNMNCVPVCRFCYSVIYNNKPLSLINMAEKVFNLQPGYLRLNFVFEDSKQVAKELNDFSKILIEEKSMDYVDFNSNDYTKGHFSRKID